jgi:hypothetical protein
VNDMMRTAILLTLAVLAVSTFAMPAQAKPEVQGNCVVEEESPEYRVCYYTDTECPRVTYRGFFGQGSLPFACGP